MSLDSILSQVNKPGHVEENIPLFFPPEYSIELDQWREMIQHYNRIGRPTKIADVIQQYIREKNPGKSTSGLISISEIVERDGSFYTDITFEKDKPGLTALLIFKAENLQLVPVSSLKGEDGIRHIVLTYIPD